jgi:hypothetical protein
VKTGRISGSSGHGTNPLFESLRIGLANPDLQICEVGFVTKIRNKSMDLQNKSTF